MKEITSRQREILAWIEQFQEDHYGQVPTFREIGLGVGIASTNRVNDVLMILERKGYVIHDRHHYVPIKSSEE